VLSAIWPGITVTEESLTKCVSEVRQALGDTGQRIIKTVPKRGYIFAVPVNSKHLGERGAIEPSITVQPYARFRRIPHRSPAGCWNGASVAVLPFANLSGDTSQEYLSDGITEDIINGLSYFSTCR